MRIRWRLVALTLLAVGQLSCAAANLTPMQESMPAARAGLLPEFRLFYDALQDYGDWILIEPYGYVFRPKADMMSWRPYSSGFWAPSDSYGWIWISEEPFGWATYHYGRWFYDHYQGWVWMPGLDWGPAWVSWEQTPDYVGWSPQFPSGFSGAAVPGGSYLFVPTAQLATPDLKTQLLTRGQVGAKLGTPEPVVDEVERDGVKFNRGPSIAAVEKLAGHLDRVKVEDMPALSSPPAKGSAGSKPAAPGAASGGGTRPQVEALKQAGEDQAEAARWTVTNKTPPPLKIQILRHLKPRSAEPAGEKPASPEEKKAAPADTSKHH